MENEDVFALLDGEAQHMGEGIFVVFQTDEGGAVQSVVLTPADLRKMLGID